MFARIAMFGLALVALWMIWRAVRHWIDDNATRPDDADKTRGRRLPHQRDDGSGAWIASGSAAERARGGVRRENEAREPDSTRNVDELRGPEHQAGDHSNSDSGSSSGDSGGGSSGD